MVFRLVIRAGKVIEYGGNYKAGDPISRELKIWNPLSLSELWLKPATSVQQPIDLDSPENNLKMFTREIWA